MANNMDFTSQHVPRPRLKALFDKACRRKIVYVIAGAGYGKTYAVQQYIEHHQDAVVRWMQLTESDNIGSRFWENLTYSIYGDNPDLAMKMRELGFPETPARFKQFTEILYNRDHRSHKSFLVLDDSHVIHSEETLKFIERGSKLDIPGLCVVILSRKEPDVSVASQVLKGIASLITEDDLRFTEDETNEFLRQQNISLSAKDAAALIKVTNGWVMAINLFASVMKRTPGNFQYALDAMRQNIFTLLENEAWNGLSRSIQKALVKISLLSGLPIMPLHEILGDTDVLLNTPGLESLIWSQSLTNDINVHPLYLEFLKGKIHTISERQQRQTFMLAAKWCLRHGFYVNAMYYYAKSQQFENMIKALFSYPIKLSHSTSEYFLEILEQLTPIYDEKSNEAIIFLKSCFIPLLLIGADRHDEAREYALDVIREWEHVDSPLAVALLYITYNNLAYTDMYTCTVTHSYKSAKYLEKALEYYKLSPELPAGPTGPFLIADIRSFACPIGEGAELAELDEFMETARQATALFSETFYNIYAGYADLVACEYAFFKNDLPLARRHAHIAVLQARGNKQYGIEALAVNYLLQIAVFEGNMTLAKELLKQLEALLDIPNFWNRQLCYDLYTGIFYVRIGILERVPQWLIADESEATSGIRVPAREIHVNALYRITLQNYSEALAVLSRYYPREPQERLLFGEIRLTLLTAVARLHIGDTKGAMADFERAYEMSFEGVLELFFVELGKELHPLVLAALRQANSPIPRLWLKTVERKASAFSKKLATIAAAFQKEKVEAGPVTLSVREREVLVDLYHGLSREEMAEYRNLSVNTVKKSIQSAYIKLGAYNSIDAIRIALEMKLIS